MGVAIVVETFVARQARHSGAPDVDGQCHPGAIVVWVLRQRHPHRGLCPVREVFIVHVGGTRYVTFSTDNIMKIHVRITLTVEVIRGYILRFLFYV